MMNLSHNALGTSNECIDLDFDPETSEVQQQVYGIIINFVKNGLHNFLGKIIRRLAYFVIPTPNFVKCNEI